MVPLFIQPVVPSPPASRVLVSDVGSAKVPCCDASGIWPTCDGHFASRGREFLFLLIKHLLPLGSLGVVGYPGTPSEYDVENSREYSQWPGLADFIHRALDEGTNLRSNVAREQAAHRFCPALLFAAALAVLDECQPAALDEDSETALYGLSWNGFLTAR